MTERGWYFLVLGLYAALGLGYSVLMPMWEAPDEQRHYLRALMVAREWEAVTIVPGVGGVPEGTQPALYYWLASRVLRLLDLVDKDLANFYRPRQRMRGPWPNFEWNSRNYRFQPGPQLLRWINLVLGGLAVVLVHRAARRVAPESKQLGLATAALAALTPQYLHISSSVSNDALGNLAGAFLFLRLCAISVQPVTQWGLALTVAAALALPFLSKLTVLPMSLAVVVAALRALAPKLRSRWQADIVWISVGVVAMAVVLLPNFGPVGWAVWHRLAYVRPDASADLRTSVSHFVWGYWGIVGILTLGLPALAVVALNSICGIGLVGSLRLLLPRSDLARRSQRAIVMSGLVLTILVAALINSWIANLGIVILLCLVYRSFQDPPPSVPGARKGWEMVWLAVAFSVLAIVKNFLATPSTQGRYLFPAIGPISLLIVGGWTVLLPEVRRWLPHLVIWPMTAVNILFWFSDIVPFYFQPFLD